MGAGNRFLDGGRFDKPLFFRLLYRCFRHASIARRFPIIQDDQARTGRVRADDFAGHSRRAGFLTSGAEAGASLFKLLEVSRHRRLESVRPYVRLGELFKEHAGADFL